MSVKSSGPAGTVEIPDPIAWNGYTCGGCKAKTSRQIAEARRLLKWVTTLSWAGRSKKDNLNFNSCIRWLERNAK